MSSDYYREAHMELEDFLKMLGKLKLIYGETRTMFNLPYIFNVYKYNEDASLGEGNGLGFQLWVDESYNKPYIHSSCGNIIFEFRKLNDNTNKIYDIDLDIFILYRLYIIDEEYYSIIKLMGIDNIDSALVKHLLKEKKIYLWRGIDKNGNIVKYRGLSEIQDCKTKEH